MSTPKNQIESFRVSCIGDVTGEKWTGTFSAKKILSHKDRMRLDQIYREFIGPHAEQVSSESADRAYAFADISVRIVESPPWWKEHDHGLEMSDNNIIREVYKAALEVEKAYLESIAKQAEEDKKALEPIHKEIESKTTIG